MSAYKVGDLAVWVDISEPNNIDHWNLVKIVDINTNSIFPPLTVEIVVNSKQHSIGEKIRYMGDTYLVKYNLTIEQYDGYIAKHRNIINLSKV